jgi:hypothetical protein
MKQLKNFFAVCIGCACTVSGWAQRELNLVAGNESVTIEWSGLDVTSIEVEGADKVVNNPVSPCVITGLENGQLYKFILNRQDADANDVNPVVGSWILTRDEGYEIYNGERDEWEYDFSPLADVSRLTFLSDGTAYGYDIFGLPDLENKLVWSRDDDILSTGYEYEDDTHTQLLTILSLTSSEMILEFSEFEESADVDRNGDGVINNDDYFSVEYYQKVTLRKVPLSTVAYAIPGEPFAPQNVEVTPGDYEGTARVSWTLSVNDRYETIYMDYLFSLNGELSGSISVYRDEEEFGVAAYNSPTDNRAEKFRLMDRKKFTATAYNSPTDSRAGKSRLMASERFTATAYNLPTDSWPWQFQLIAVQYVAPEDGGGGEIPIIGKSTPVTVTATGNEDIAFANIYTSEGRLYIHTLKDDELKVYTSTGQLYRQQHISTGQTSIPLARGLYIVTLGKRTAKVYVR